MINWNILKLAKSWHSTFIKLDQVTSYLQQPNISKWFMQRSFFKLVKHNSFNNQPSSPLNCCHIFLDKRCLYFSQKNENHQAKPASLFVWLIQAKSASWIPPIQSFRCVAQDELGLQLLFPTWYKAEDQQLKLPSPSPVSLWSKSQALCRNLN